MKVRTLTGFILSLAVAVLSGCGGDGAADPNAPAAVTLTVSKALALANGSDAVTIQADVRNGEGAAVANGTAVIFSATDGTLLATSATTTNGIASATLTRAAVAGANNQTITVTGRAGSVAGTGQVKFINQPASADVFIAFDQAVTNLAALSFRLNNTAGATFDNGDPTATPPRPQPISAINNAATGTGSLVQGNFSAGSNSIGLISGNANGFNTGTTPIIKATYQVSAGLPAFSVDLTPASFTATDTAGGATSPAVTAANLAVTVTFDTEQ